MKPVLRFYCFLCQQAQPWRIGYIPSAVTGQGLSCPALATECRYSFPMEGCTFHSTCVGQSACRLADMGKRCSAMSLHMLADGISFSMLLMPRAAWALIS
jgi:hypothetical protein